MEGKYDINKVRKMLNVLTTGKQILDLYEGYNCPTRGEKYHSFVYHALKIVNEAEDLRVLFKLDDVGKEGYNISRLSNHQSESEVLLRPKTKMTIKSTKLESAEKYGGSGGNILIIEATVK